MNRNRKEEKKKASTRKMIGIKEITEDPLITYDQGQLAYFLIKPTNISVLSEESIRARVYSLMTVLKRMPEIEMCAYNSRENFDGNKRYMKKRIEEEPNYIIRHLLERDMQHLDDIQVQTATAREFAVVVRFRKETEKEKSGYISEVAQKLRDTGFIAKRAMKEDIQKLVAVYFEQNITQEVFEDHDGDRGMIYGEEGV